MNILKSQNSYIALSRNSRGLFYSMLLVSCFAVLGCDDNGNVFSDDLFDDDPPGSVSGPTVVLSENAPLAAVLTLTTDEPTEVTVDVSSNSVETNSVSNTARDFSVSSGGFATEHAITLLGFRPDESYDVHVTLTDKAGNEAVLNDIPVTTAPLPVGFPPIQVLTSMPELMEPGVTLFPVNGRGKNGGFHSLIAVNELGEVVWYSKPSDVLFDDVRRLSNGNLIYIDDAGHFEIGEMDMLGNVVRKWFASSAETTNPDDIVIETERFHHEI